MKKYWKWLLLVALVIVVIVGVALYRRDSNGKPFKASLNHERIMMTPDWDATVKLTANKGATYQVLNSKKEAVQSNCKTQNGKADIKLTKAGNYTIVAKSDNGHVSKKLPLKVTNYKANINKETNSVGPLKFKITDVEYKEMTKSNKNRPDDSLIEGAYRKLNKHYYQITINYMVQNTGNKPVDPEYTFWSPQSDDGQEFSTQSPTPDAIASDNIIGTTAINSKTKRSGSVILISNNKFSVKHFKFNVGEILDNDGEHIAKGGMAKIK